MKPEQRATQTSVTIFLHHNGNYLMLKRHQNKTLDPGKLNGIGGKVEPGENYATAAIRETLEETGYVLTAADLTLSGLVRLEGGYGEDWIMGFFSAPVPDKRIPKGTHTTDGEFIWIQHDKVLTSGYEVVDDLHYCFDDIVANTHIFFMSATVGTNLKISHASMTRIPRVTS